MEQAFGVFSPRGELEAVELSEDMATAVGDKLSPDPKRPNRIILRVTVIPGDIETFVKDLITNAALDVFKQKGVRLDQAANKVAKVLCEASATKSAVVGDYWHDAHKTGAEYVSAYGLLSAAAEIKVNEGT